MDRDGDSNGDIVAELRALIEQNDWSRRFREALAGAQRKVVENNIKTFPQIAPENPEHIIDPSDLDTYYRYLDWLVHWIPREVVVRGVSHRNVYNDIINFYYILGQEKLSDLQVPIQPGQEVDFERYPLSKWIVDFANQWGCFLDTPESAAGIPSFEEAPEFNWDEYMPTTVPDTSFSRRAALPSSTHPLAWWRASPWAWARCRRW